MTESPGLSSSYQRALLLLQQSRPADAERELRQVLTHQPNHAMAHAMLARCLVEQDRLDEAQEHAQKAIGIEPDEPMTHYILSLVMFARNRYEEAGQAITEAIGLDPNDPDLHAMLAQVLIQERRWKDARTVAERGLAIDSEHVGCTNLRAIALVHLGQREQAGQTIDAALRRDPSNALTHANQGWTLLHQSKPKEAMEHFRESLRLDPTSEWARAGIVEALKARNIIYRWMLGYFLFMSRLGGGMQWGIIIGLWVMTQILDRIADSNPAAAPYVRPIVYAYVGFVLMTWLSPHLFNLLLRLSRFGRHALSEEQVRASNLMLGMLILAGLTLAGATIAHNGELLVLGMCILGLLMPLAGAFQTPRGWPRAYMFIITGALALVAVVMYWLASPMEPMTGARASAWQSLIWLFVVGVIASQFIANLLASQPVKK